MLFTQLWEKFAAMEETLHLLSTSANAERSRQGLDDNAAGSPATGKVGASKPLIEFLKSKGITVIINGIRI